MRTEGTITLADGRALGYAEFGPEDGTPVLWFHGMPGSRLQWFEHPDLPPMRAIALERPGYGFSDPKPGRRVGDWPADVLEAADKLGVGTFHVAGGSGGGPYVLACAAVLDGRVTGAAVMCGAGIFDEDWREGMHPGNVGILEVGRQGEDALREALAAQLSTPPPAAPPSPEQMAAAMEGIPHCDIAMLSRPDMAFLQAAQVEALRNGVEGLVSDDIAIFDDWGLDLTSIAMPVRFWHGTLDTNVPIRMARNLHALVPGSELTVLEGHGHLSLFDLVPEIFTALIATGR